MTTLSEKYLPEDMTFKSSKLPVNEQKKIRKDSGDPKVIDDLLIRESIREYNSEFGIIYPEMLEPVNQTQLSLSFKNIWKIQNLEGLENLRKLQMDNNIIENISGIDHLVNLTWLDLSFNCIKEIKGLEKLVNLEDLSLFNNQISDIKGLDQLSKLNIFSIGNNKIQNYDTIIQEFGFKPKDDKIKYQNLQVLNVAGNPFDTKGNGNYKSHLIVAIPGLKYLDYIYIDEVTRKKYQDDPEICDKSLQGVEKAYQEKMQKTKLDQKQAQEQLQKKINSKMDQFDDFDVILTSSEEFSQLKILNKIAIEDEIQKFRQKIREAIGIDGAQNQQGIQFKIFAQNDKLQKKREKFELAIMLRQMQGQDDSLALIEKYNKIKKDSFRKIEYLKEIKEGNYKEEIEKELDFMRRESKKLETDLMQVEIVMAEEMDTDIINKFSNQQLKDQSQMDEWIDAGFENINKSIEAFNQKLRDLCKIEKDKFDLQQEQQSKKKDKDQELEKIDSMAEINEEAQDRMNMLMYYDTVTQHLTTIVDDLESKKSKKQQDVSSQIHASQEQYVKAEQNRQYERNRQQIKQIKEQLGMNHEDIEKQEIQEEEDDD